jgi:predicted TIM-barrel fold metal-dependent hydrolase
MAYGIRCVRLGIAAGAAALIAAGSLLAAGGAPAQDRPPPERRFRFMDQNGDGRVSRDEFRGPPPAFDRIDQNRDGALSLEEFVAFVSGRRAGPPTESPRRMPAPPARPEAPPAALPVIDTHAHLMKSRRRSGGGWEEAARAALESMDRMGIRTTIIMSPPLPASRAGEFDEAGLLATARQYPGRFAVMAGGSSLNPMIHGAPKDGPLGPELRQRFERTAEELLRQGAVGFGEVTALHFSFYGNHPFEERAPDHPLFLLLADVAARHGVAIDLHMEAVATPFEVPQWLRERSASNPASIGENIAALERLLEHNRKARIVWAHAGMDTTNQRSPALMARLFRRHPNLYAAIKIAPLPGTVYRVLRQGGTLDPAWRAVMIEFPDRFLIGSDEFYAGEGGRRRQRPQSTAGALDVLRHLPPAVARKIAYENAQAIYRLP